MKRTPEVVETADGSALSVWSAGPVDGETVYLLHGFTLDHSTWEPLAAELTARGFRIIAPDLRGHGASSLGSAPPTVERLVADIDVVATSMGLPAIHLVGHSLGAVVALAARTDADLAAKLLSVTSIAGTERSIQNPVLKIGARFFSSKAGVWALGRRRLGRLIISSWFGKRPRTEHLDWIRELSRSCLIEARTAVASATSDIDLRPTFAQPGPPTLVVCGRKDQATPLKFSQRIAAGIDGSELAVLDAAGHMVPIEQPTALADRLTTWIESHSP